MAKTKKMKASEARKNAEALKAKKKQLRLTKAKTTAPGTLVKNGKKTSAGIKKSGKKK